MRDREGAMREKGWMVDRCGVREEGLRRRVEG